LAYYIQNFVPHPAVKVNPHIQRKLLGIIYVDFDATGQHLIIYPAFIKYLRKNGNKKGSASAVCRLQEGL
jgi:hypothetical protein